MHNGLMTPTLKVEKKKIIEKYKQDLENLYSIKILKSIFCKN